MTKDRAYQRFLAVLELARRPGTPEEGEAAWEMARNLANKYGFDLNAVGNVNEQEKKQAREVVRKWKQYQGDKKKDMMTIYKIAQSVGYVVDGDKILVSPQELKAIVDCKAYYTRAKKAARRTMKAMTGGTSRGFSEMWDLIINNVCGYSYDECIVDASATIVRFYDSLFVIKDHLYKNREV